VTQGSGRIFDGFGKIMTDAVGVADSMRREVDTIVRTQAERILADLDLVRREEFEAVRELAANARSEAEHLATQLAALEARLAKLDGGASDSPSDRGAAPTTDEPA